MKLPEYNEVLDIEMGGPHVVILGAGASLAAFPNGDANGKRLPLMNNLVSVCQLNKIITRAGIDFKGENFEDFYSELYSNNYNDLLYELETVVFNYFRSLELPDYPTIYDLLAVSLRPKDLIVTFNWDPLLWQALKRNDQWARGPQVLYLHGNVAIGYCMKDMTLGPRGAKCTKCQTIYENAKLLYPIKEKNYNHSPFIKTSWEELKKYLKHAYILTIFGYGAPETDVEAIKLLKEGWGDKGKRELEQTEIIDIRSPDELLKTWEPFILSHHYEIHSNFRESIVARHPRRSCEAMWAMLMECQFLDDYKIPETNDWSQLKEWFAPRLEFENTKKVNR